MDLDVLWMIAVAAIGGTAVAYASNLVRKVYMFVRDFRQTVRPMVIDFLTTLKSKRGIDKEKIMEIENALMVIDDFTTAAGRAVRNLFGKKW